MSLDVTYSYCINLTEEEKIEIDKQVRKNRFALKFAIFFPFLPFPIVRMPQVPFFPVEGFSPQQIVRNARDRAESAVAEKLSPLAQLVDDCQEFYNEYKVYNKMSSTLSKVSKKVRKDKKTSKSLDKLEEQLKNGEFHAGRGAEKLSGTKSVYYMRAGNRGRLFFRYSKEEKGAVEKLAESNKDEEPEVIHNLKQNY
jgi:Txe/YoeB family toxin of Txe-Axe toxin-antitoxin module